MERKKAEVDAGLPAEWIRSEEEFKWDDEVFLIERSWMRMRLRYSDQVGYRQYKDQARGGQVENE
jgi:hypothetical protein